MHEPFNPANGHLVSRVRNFKLCKHVFFKILFLHHTYSSNLCLSLKLERYFSCSLLFWHCHLEKEPLFDKAINDLSVSTLTPIFLIRDIHDNSLYNVIQHLDIAPGKIYSFNFKMVSGIKKNGQSKTIKTYLQIGISFFLFI